ncbi:helicase-related protein [Rothia sp. 11254D007CT]
MAQIYDNKSIAVQGLDIDTRTMALAGGLRRSFKHFTSIDIATGYIDLRGWGEIAEQVATKPFDAESGAPIARILVGMVARSDAQAMLEQLQHDVRSDEPPRRLMHDERNAARDGLVRHLRDQLTRGLPTHEAEQALKALGEHLASGRVQMKVYTVEPLHGKTYIFRGGSYHQHTAYVGSSNFTRAGLTSNLELNVEVEDQDQCQKLSTWFSGLWDDQRSLPITQEILEILQDSWVNRQASPYEIYLKVCYSLSQDMRNGSGYVLPRVLEKKLLDYQKTAVKILARRIVRRGGTMLGDVVGLGKTLTAIGTAAMLQNAEEYRTLVLCPKNLVEMWKQALADYEIEGAVVSYSMAHRELGELRRRYHFVICDESHNLRNSSIRVYKAIKDFISEWDCKVLLLTATPFNLSFEDVGNQLALYIDDDYDLGISPTVALEKDPSLEAKVDGKLTYLSAFMKSNEPEDWKRLMSDHLVRRTRSFVRKTAKRAPLVLADGTPVLLPNGDPEMREYMEFTRGDSQEKERFFFPNRVSEVISHDFTSDDPASVMESEETLDALKNLKLPRYSLHTYHDERKPHTDEDQEIMKNVASGRGNVAGFVRTGLFKRLSSSGFSFVESLKRQKSRNEVFLYALDNGLKLPLGSFSEVQFGSDLDIEPDLPVSESSKLRYDALQRSAPRETKWVSSTIFKSSLRKDLQHDIDSLDYMLAAFGNITVETDSKLKVLADFVKQHEGEKVLIFTEYKDTAYYLAQGLKQLGVQRVEAVSGDTEDPASLAQRFSPLSNQDVLQGDEVENEIDVLVATDVLSEGQNLQDSHIVVNYDLPWAIIRLIQRAGRVDRVGQLSPTVNIYLISHENIEHQLSLRSRIQQRLVDSASAFGSDEQFFGTEQEKQILDDFYNGRMADESLDEDDSADATSVAWEVWSWVLEHKPELAKRIERMQDQSYSTRELRPQDRNKYVGSYVSTESGLDIFAVREFVPETAQYRERLMTADEALRFFEAEESTPTLDRLDDHFEMHAQVVRFALNQENVTAGNLRGTRKRVWRRFHSDSARLGSMDSLLATVENADEALNALYESPLQSAAEDELRRALRAQVSEAELAALLVRLHEEGRLVLSGIQNDPARVVCSLGVIAP